MESAVGLAGQVFVLIVAPFVGSLLGALVGLMRRRREHLDDLRRAAMSAAAQMKAASYLGAPRVHDPTLFIDEQEKAEWVKALRTEGMTEYVRRQGQYRSALAALDHVHPELRRYWDREGLGGEAEYDAVIELLRGQVRRRRLGSD